MMRRFRWLQVSPLWLLSLGSAIVLPLLGVLTGAADDADQPRSAARPWHWPALPPAPPRPAPPLSLARLWPVTPTDATELALTDAKAKAALQQQRQPLTLVGIINNGGSLSALVLEQGTRLRTVKTGMLLDKARTVLRIDSDRLHWRDQNGRQGVLTLYPPEFDTKPTSGPFTTRS